MSLNDIFFVRVPLLVNIRLDCPFVHIFTSTIQYVIKSVCRAHHSLIASTIGIFWYPDTTRFVP